MERGHDGWDGVDSGMRGTSDKVLPSHGSRLLGVVIRRCGDTGVCVSDEILESQVSASVVRWYGGAWFSNCRGTGDSGCDRGVW